MIAATVSQALFLDKRGDDEEVSKEAVMAEDLKARWPRMVKPPQLDEYAERYAEFFKFERRDGILEVRMHTNDGPWTQDWAGHNAFGRVFQEIGTDSENEVIILTGTGDVWFDSHPSLAVPVTSIDETIQIFYDSVKEMENLIFGIDVPTIAAVNGPAPGHSQIAIACDITLCSDRTVFVDPHFLSGRPPGDGLGLTYQELMGTKRAAYNLYTSQLIDAQAALDLGLVSEVVPHDQLRDRAWTLAEMIMRRPRAARRATHAIISRPWKQRLVSDFGFQLMHQFWGYRVDTMHAPPDYTTKVLDGDIADGAEWVASVHRAGER